MSVAAIVLAAGGSRRLGRPKQLVIYRHETLLARSVRLAQESGASPLFVVLGAHYQEIAGSISFPGVGIIHNQLWEQGMASSLHSGLRAVEAEASRVEGVLVLACDQPFVTAAHLRELIDKFNQQRAAAIAASLYGGVRGIPAVFPRSMFQSLHAIVGDRGARSLLNEPNGSIVVVDFPQGETDVDLPSDLRHLE